jgi:predicted phosphoribosyltransferase
MGGAVARQLGFEEHRFRDRTAAGEALLEALRAGDLKFDLVLAIPRGGLPVAAVIAAGLGLPLDVLVARKVGAPGQPELALGAVTRFGAYWNETVLEGVSLSERELENRERQAVEEVMRREQAYRDPSEARSVSGRRVILVDDGIATGATMAAAVGALQSAGAERIMVAVPVASANAVARIELMGADVLALLAPSDFFGVGQFYRDFGQVPDDECIAILERMRSSPSPRTDPTTAR